MKFLKWTEGILFHPNKFFQKMKKITLTEGFIFFLIYQAISIPLNTLVSTIQPLQGSIYNSWVATLLSGILGIGLIFIATTILHLFFKIVKGKGAYKDSFNLYIFASVPGILTSIIINVVLLIPRINITTLLLNPTTLIPFLILLLAIAIWTAILFVKGGSAIHKISIRKAVIATIILPLLTSLILGTIIVATFGLTFLTQL